MEVLSQQSNVVDDEDNREKLKKLEADYVRRLDERAHEHDDKLKLLVKQYETDKELTEEKHHVSWSVHVEQQPSLLIL